MAVALPVASPLHNTCWVMFNVPVIPKAGSVMLTLSTRVQKFASVIVTFTNPAVKSLRLSFDPSTVPLLHA